VYILCIFFMYNRHKLLRRKLQQQEYVRLEVLATCSVLVVVYRRMNYGLVGYPCQDP